MYDDRPLMAQEPTVTSLMTKELKDIPGKEGLMITVEYPPGGSDLVRRHNAHGFIYVLEGSVVMQVRGGKEVTLTMSTSLGQGPGVLGQEERRSGASASKLNPGVGASLKGYSSRARAPPATAWESRRTAGPVGSRMA